MAVRQEHIETIVVPMPQTEPQMNQRLTMNLSDRLDQDEGWVYMTGMQALKLPAGVVRTN